MHLPQKKVKVAESLLVAFLEKKPKRPRCAEFDGRNSAPAAQRFEDAEEMLCRCLSQSPESAGFRYNYAVVLRNLHKYETSTVAN